MSFQTEEYLQLIEQQCQAIMKSRCINKIVVLYEGGILDIEGQRSPGVYIKKHWEQCLMGVRRD